MFPIGSLENILQTFMNTFVLATKSEVVSIFTMYSALISTINHQKDLNNSEPSQT